MADIKPEIFLILSLIGMLSLLLFLIFLEPKQITPISKITQKNINQEIKIKAEIITIRDFPKERFQILKLKDNSGNITAVSNSAKALNIQQNQSYVFTGKIQEYNHSIQMNINQITIFSV